MDGIDDADLIWNVNVTYVSASDEEVIQLQGLACPVSVQHFWKTDIHEGVDINNPSSDGALVSQLHSGDMAMYTLEKDDEAVLRNCSLFNGVAHRHDGSGSAINLKKLKDQVQLPNLCDRTASESERKNTRNTNVAGL